MVLHRRWSRNAPPTKTTSIGTASGSRGSVRMSRSIGSGGWCASGRTFRPRSGAMLVSLSRFAHGGAERWNNLEHVADDSVVGDFEDRRLLVLVDRDDRS